MLRSLASGVAVFLVVLAAAQATVGGVAADDVTLTITTTDSDGDPRGSVSFSATWDGGQENATTRSNGQALIDVPEDAEVTVQITDRRFVRNDPFVIENATTRQVQIPVSPSGQATITVQGSNGAIENATVSVSNGGPIVDEGSTGPDGTYQTTPVEQGNYALRVTKPGYYDNSTSLFIGSDTETTVRLRTGAVEATFNVTDDHFDPARPIEGAMIDIPEAGTTLSTLDDGTRSTTLPVNRNYQVTIDKDGYQSVTTTLVVEEEDVTHTVSTQRVPEMNLEAANDRVVVGETVLLSATNEYDEPIVGGTVTVGGETVGETNGNGEFAAPVESAGNLTIAVSQEDLSAEVTVEGIEPASEETPTATSTATPTDASTATPTATPGSDGPGFGVVAAVLAVLGAVLLARRRQ